MIQKKLRPYLIIVLASVYFVAMISIGSQLFYLITYAIMILFLGFLFARELKVLLWDYFRYYMFNLEKKARFDKRIERPRLAFYLIFGVSSVFCFYQHIYFGLESSLPSRIVLGVRLLFFIFFWISAFVLLYTWSNDFAVIYIPRIQEELLKSKNEKYSLRWNSLDVYEQLFENLYDFNFIVDFSERNRKMFVAVLSKGKIPEEPLFKLEMDNIQARLFFDLLSEKSEGFTMKTFIKIFKNKNGTINYNSMKASASRNNFGPKRSIEIKNCFEFKNVDFLYENVNLG